VTLTVNPLPIVGLNHPDPFVCANTPKYSLKGGTPANGRYFMEDEHGGYLHLPYINFSNFLPDKIGEGNYFIAYEYTDPATGCSATAKKPFEIRPYLRAQFYTSREDICLSNEISIANHTVPATGIQYQWEFGDGTTSTETTPKFKHNFPENDNITDYTIKLTATNLVSTCVSTQQRNVRVFPSVVSKFRAEPDSLGCSDLSVNFFTESTGPILFHFWDFDDGTFSVENNPSKTFANHSDTVRIYNVILTVMSTNYFCTSSDTIPITVYPAISAGFTVNPVQGCHPLEIEIGNLATGATDYYWDFGNGTFSHDQNPANPVYHNTTSDTLHFTIKQIVSNAWCSDTISHDIVVYPQIVANISASDTEGCSPFEVIFTNHTSDTATQFEWDFGDGGTSSSKDTVHVFENNTNAPITYRVWMRARTDFFCTDSAFIDITVNPFLKANFSFSPEQGCNPHDVDIINKTAYGAVDYLWDMGDGTTYTYDSGTPQFTHTYEHNSHIPVEYEIKLSITNGQGCQDYIIRPITIFPKIEAAFTPSVLEGCSPLTVFFENNSTGVQNYLWELGDGGSSLQDTLTHTFYNTSFTQDTIFDVWLYTQSEYLCRDSVNHQIRVFPAILANFTINDNQGCSPFLVTIDNHSRGFETLHWDFNDGNTSTDTTGIITHVFENKTSDVRTFTILLEAFNATTGCMDTITRTITVYPEVNISYTHPLEGCHPLTVPIINETENANYHSWIFGDGGLSNVFEPTHVFHNISHIAETTFEITYYASSIYGCFATETTQVEVFPKPDGSFNVTNSPGCSPHEIIIEHNSQGAINYLWNFGDSNDTFDYSSAEVKHLYNHEPGSGPGKFLITLITDNTFGCMDTLVQQVVIYPNVNAAFTASITEGCHPLTVNLTNQSYGATAQSAYFWDYGNGNTSNNLQSQHLHTFYNFSHTRDTVYTIALTAYNENECSHTETLQVRVLPQPKAYFSTPNTPGCAPHDIIINNYSEGDKLQYTWDMGNGETHTKSDDYFTHLYHQPADQGPGIFTISLNIKNEFNCSQTHAQQIVIYPEIIPEFETQPEGCHPHVADFKNNSRGGNLYTWDFGNGVISHSPEPRQTYINYSHTETETYTVSLKVESTWGCAASDSLQVTVMPRPKPLFELSPFNGCAPFTPEISNLSVGATRFEWDMGNDLFETTDSLFTHTWNNNTESILQFPLTLQAWSDYGCETSTTQTISVYPEVTAAFNTLNNIWEGCSPLELKFENASLLAQTYLWDFKDSITTSSASPLHFFQNNNMDTQTFPVELIARSLYGCTDTVVRDVTVFPSPDAYFAADPKKQPYPNATVKFNNGTNPGYWNFKWEFGDGNNHQSTSFDPVSHTYIWNNNDMSTKEYVVALIVSNEHCEDIHTDIITITSPVPKAAFSSTMSGCAPFNVQFSNHSMYAHSFRWSFSDGGGSVDPAPRYLFMDPGIHEVKMVAIGDGGRDTIYHYIEVIENPTALFNLESAYVNIPDEPLRLKNHSLLADFYLWDFGDGNTSYDFEPEHYYEKAGIYDVSLVATRNSEPLCYDTLSLKNALRVEESCKIIFPDAFVPLTTGPSDGRYDLNNPTVTVFHPVYEGVDTYELEIFNRWGELLFRSNDINVGWDGYHKGQLSQMDVYVWKASGRCNNGQSYIKSGDVTLYR